MTYKFTPGKYKTRDGREARVLCDDAPGVRPLIGYYMLGNDECVASSWASDGKFIKSHHLMDLMPPVTEPEQVVRWVVLWNDSGLTLESSPPPILAGRKACTRVVLTPGVFEDEDTPSFAEVAALIERCPYHDGRDWLWEQMPAIRRRPA